ncbi:MAG: cytochrome ubiquinol oxidase subunit I [candidate division Zixibacteria bacterium]|nr:cytochrome ubiquinol oxidase subunit I [candidate division Zixibacteria bacterium]MBU1470902.1 cytochrome ubiquinol oxidase subunit I [candidate division Zixibacteria bacterium]MBU2624280.1 cytochrome ubiquinol oxidase subunit I [candidate division Zixibacteria bacterium]
MDLEFLSRLQFGITIAFHYIFPPLSIGLGVILVIMEGIALKTGKPLYEQMTRFWVKIFGLIFALGVATGIVMEFQFGMNWASYSRYVGDVFGSALAAEGIFAFFLESGFLAILLFGWDKVKPRTHFISTLLVALGAHMSAIWIVVANSWQQTPAGHHIVNSGDSMRAEIVDFWQVVFNPSFLDRVSHVYMGAWQAGAFFVLSVSAFYLLKKKHTEFAKASIKIAVVVALFASVMQLVTGHSSAITVSETQPAKLAAFEGHYPASAPAGAYLFGWVDDDNETVSGIAIPGLLSFLVNGDADEPVTGLKAFPPEDRPPVNLVFQSYHVMVSIGMLLILIALLGAIWLWSGSLFRRKWLLWVFVFSVFLPQLANQLGWFTAEVGRQPWIVYGLLRTSEGLSKSVGSGQVTLSLVMFSLIYMLLFALFFYLLNEKIQHGPETVDGNDGRHLA